MSLKRALKAANCFQKRFSGQSQRVLRSEFCSQIWVSGLRLWFALRVWSTLNPDFTLFL